MQRKKQALQEELKKEDELYKSVLSYLKEYCGNESTRAKKQTCAALHSIGDLSTTKLKEFLKHEDFNKEMYNFSEFIEGKKKKDSSLLQQYINDCSDEKSVEIETLIDESKCNKTIKDELKAKLNAFHGGAVEVIKTLLEILAASPSVEPISPQHEVSQPRAEAMSSEVMQSPDKVHRSVAIDMLGTMQATDPSETISIQGYKRDGFDNKVELISGAFCESVDDFVAIDCGSVYRGYSNQCPTLALQLTSEQQTQIKCETRDFISKDGLYPDKDEWVWEELADIIQEQIEIHYNADGTTLGVFHYGKRYEANGTRRIVLQERHYKALLTRNEAIGWIKANWHVY